MTAIANNHVVSFHYKLTNAEGETLDQSQGEPLAYLHGAGNIIPGLENALTVRLLVINSLLTYQLLKVMANITQT